MTVEIGNIFKATAKSSWDFLVTQGQGCYIPAYQRPYSWDKENVERLFEDAIQGLNLLLKREKTISFLGTVIAIHDTTYATVQPIYRQEMPPKVMTIIDGQQRISTFMMINIVFHEFASVLLNSVRKKEEPHMVWVKDELEKLRGLLIDSLILDNRTGEGKFQYYPRIARAYDDAWSNKSSQAKYESPITKLVWEYFLSSDFGCGGGLKYEPLETKGASEPSNLSVIEVFNSIRRLVKNLCHKKAYDLDFPDLIAMTQNDSFVTAIWNYKLPEEVKVFARDSREDSSFSTFVQSFRLLVLAKYLNDRMAFTVVTAENEDDAFDMFEALNTTGEPLTAFETFKPKVIEAEGMECYKDSPSYEFVAEIESYLVHFKKAEQKQAATSEMLVPFALSETGEKRQKRLVDQRRYLREQFDSLGLSDLVEKRKFVFRLASLATYMRCAWSIPAGGKADFGFASQPDSELAVGFQMLRDIKHHITVAPLSRFFHEIRSADRQAVNDKVEEFYSAMRATVAFTTIWRGAYGGTNNIDGCYRGIMSEGGGNDYPALAARPKNGAGAVSLSNYKSSLRKLLEAQGIAQKEKWIQLAAKVPIYKANKSITRYLLFLAAHDSVCASGGPGLIERGRSDCAPVLTLENWTDQSSYFTVEHVAPRSNNGSWSNELYDEPETIDSIGNLILLPATENSVLSNRSWVEKRAVYRVLSAKTDRDFDEFMGVCRENKIELSAKAEEVLRESKYRSMCESVGMLEGDWTAEFVLARSERLVGLAWDRMAEWLDL